MEVQLFNLFVGFVAMEREAKRVAETQRKSRR